MTTRLDHSNCSHETSPVARRACRARRLRDIRELQETYMEVAADTNFTGQRDYEAMVQLFAINWGMGLMDAYQLIENGPVVL